MVVDLIRSRVTLEAEIWTLRQQINVMRRTAPKKLSFSAIDRLVFVGLYRLFPEVCGALAIVKPGTIVRWHRAGLLMPVPLSSDGVESFESGLSTLLLWGTN